MKKILVTGTSRGLGETLVQQLSTSGHEVYGTTRNMYDFLEPTATSRCFKDYRDCDVLINNAGICYPYSEHNVPAFEETMQVNFHAPVDLSIRFTAHWISQGIRGTIINVLSRVANKGSINAPHYACSKAALASFTNSWGARYAESINVFGIAPSWIDTDIMSANMVDEEAEIASIPLKRVLTTQELVPYFQFLISDKAAYMTGQILDVNGASYFH